MKDNNNLFVLDTSAIFTYIEDEEGSDKIEELLIKAEKEEVFIFICFITLVEVFYITLREKGKEEALKRLQLICSLKVNVVESNYINNLKAGELKARNKISIADAYISALSLLLECVLVHKDPQFENITPKIKEFRLPYKT